MKYCTSILIGGGVHDSLIRSDIKISQNEFYKTDEKSVGLCSYLQGLDCDYIFVHSLFFSGREILEILRNKKLYRKLVWIEWGADLYSWKMQGRVRGKIKNYVNFRFRNDFQHIVCIFPPDMEYFKQQFPKSKAKLYYAPYAGYPNPEEYEHYSSDCELQKNLEFGNTIYIQIGQNGMTTLNHKRVLENLSKFKDENIHLILPLSYAGKKEYVDDVINYANQLFPGKVTILRDFMPKDEYFALMQKVSIAIFDTERQCALSNIHRLNFRNVKLFLSENGVMYSYFLKQGVSVEKCEDIRKMTFEQFVEVPSKHNQRNFQKYIYELSHIETSVEKWNQIYLNLKQR